MPRPQNGGTPDRANVLFESRQLGRGHISRFAPHDKPKDTRKTISRLLELTKGYRRGLMAAFALSGLVAVVPVLGPLVIGQVVKMIGAGEPTQLAILALLALYVGDWIVRTAQGLVINTIGQRIVLEVRLVLFKALERLPLRYFDTHLTGDLMSRVTNDVDNISTTLSTSLAELMTLAFTIAGMLVAMFALSVPLTLIALVAVAFIFAFTRFLTRHTKPLFSQQQRALGALNAHIEEDVSGISLVKAFGRQAMMEEEFARLNDEYTRVATKAQIWSGFLMPVTGVINNMIYVAVAVAGGVMAAQGSVDVGLVASFLLYSKQFTRPFVNIASMYNTLQTALAGAERVFQVVDETTEPPDSPDALPISRPQGHLTLDRVTFGYDPDRPVLRDICLDIPAGTRVAIVGETGSGKTTLANLLARMYDVTDGSIQLDGTDIRRYRLADLRACFGVVPQDAVLMTATVAQNIAYGLVGTDDRSGNELNGDVRQIVVEAAQTVGAAPFIERLPQGYDTLLEGSGAALSQGERQLLTIARAMAAARPILILDEATSSVDTVTERRIKQALFKLTEGRTSIIIAHRLATVRDSDVIVVLKEGRVAEQGTHDDLVSAGGIYASMWHAQTS